MFILIFGGMRRGMGGVNAALMALKEALEGR